MSIKVTAIVAVDALWGIGRDGELPWDLPGDMRHFKETTTGQGNNAVIMGRTTWESIPEKYRPLKGRKNIVVSKTLSSLDGAFVASGVAGALELASTCERVFCIGGASVYKSMLSTRGCDELIITHIDEEFDCDVFFPNPSSQFEEVEVIAEGSDDGLPYIIKRWRRRQ